jgi:hypothetical protein
MNDIIVKILKIEMEIRKKGFRPATGRHRKKCKDLNLITFKIVYNKGYENRFFSIFGV